MKSKFSECPDFSCSRSEGTLEPPPGGGAVLPYMGYIGMCGPKGYGFSAVLVINRVSNLALHTLHNLN